MEVASGVGIAIGLWELVDLEERATSIAPSHQRSHAVEIARSKRQRANQPS
jgi:hypothetical protein